MKNSFNNPFAELALSLNDLAHSAFVKAIFQRPSSGTILLSAFVHHVQGLDMPDVEVSLVQGEQRLVIVPDNVAGASFDNVKAKRASSVPFFKYYARSAISLCAMRPAWLMLDVLLSSKRSTKHQLKPCLVS